MFHWVRYWEFVQFLNFNSIIFLLYFLSYLIINFCQVNFFTLKNVNYLKINCMNPVKNTIILTGTLMKTVKKLHFYHVSCFIFKLILNWFLHYFMAFSQNIINAKKYLEWVIYCLYASFYFCYISRTKHVCRIF